MLNSNTVPSTSLLLPQYTVATEGMLAQEWKQTPQDEFEFEAIEDLARLDNAEFLDYLDSIEEYKMASMYYDGLPF